jgi:hypothetical protein
MHRARSITVFFQNNSSSSSSHVAAKAAKKLFGHERGGGLAVKAVCVCRESISVVGSTRKNYYEGKKASGDIFTFLLFLVLKI